MRSQQVTNTTTTTGLTTGNPLRKSPHDNTDLSACAPLLRDSEVVPAFALQNLTKLRSTSNCFAQKSGVSFFLRGLSKNQPVLSVQVNK